ncbi:MULTISPECIES: outer membrane lipoprotein [Massilia]|uniref:Glycine zipper 2TM domain-containing protein n=1 Tax=Massilia haematophila TaxID=457923 RepID=A0ABV7PQB4_9BURK|nr:glycine zipper 2TM domain-containing protein [Massilia sp.]
MKTTLPLAALLAAGLLAGCATPPPSGSVYRYGQTQNEQVVRMGTVESVRNVTIVNPESGVGTMGGAALGGIGGAQIGSGSGSAAASVAGAIAGGLLGNRIEANANQRPGFEITVRLDSGELRAITQAADEMFRPGERVRLLSDGYQTRVTH